MIHTRQAPPALKLQASARRYQWPSILDIRQPTTSNPTSNSSPSTPTIAIMSDGEIEVESPSGYAILPKEVTDEIGSVKLFNKARTSQNFEPPDLV